MTNSPITELAKSTLSTWEELFNNQLSQYPEFYLEYRILSESRNWSYTLIDEIFKYSDQYTTMHQVLHDCWDYFESNYERVFPLVTQKKIIEIAKLATEASSPNSLSARSVLLTKLAKFKTPKGACSYFQEVERGFHICFNIFRAKSFDSNESKGTLKLLGRIGCEADMTSSLALEELLSLENQLKVDIKSLLEERVRNLIELGEINPVEYVEFKESLTLSRRARRNGNKSQKSIEAKTLKCLAAFLNTEGGYLILGVDDDRNIRGVEQEVNEKFNSNYDNFYLHIQSIIKGRLGPDASRLINISPCSIDSKSLVFIEVASANRPVEFDNTLYIRKFAKCEALEEQTREDYLRVRFPS
ncbi:helix-turn-helix domain-containing protein [Idiomarina sp. UBA4520]|uniref:AlbA family DNA-binding domain-containing protein n=1 Tax=Idiomarina sp. UBA4520 TaxID=1946647 RepID=UPI000C646CF7|nr:MULTISPECIES: ATP-binding protein [unclassified Idiomarina]MBF38329.1 hypothetical protein [Idiomarinaceae bacterium]